MVEQSDIDLSHAVRSSIQKIIDDKVSGNLRTTVRTAVSRETRIDEVGPFGGLVSTSAGSVVYGNRQIGVLVGVRAIAW